MQLKNKVIVVTGAGHGIGAALCRRFAVEQPEHIAVLDLDADAAQAVAAEIGGRAYGCDVTDEEAMQAVIRDIEERNGRIDLFFSNAGLADFDGPGGICGERSGLDTWDRLWKVNVLAHVIAARAVLPNMLARGDGYICSTASAAGLLNQIGGSIYGTTKHAAVGFAESISIHHGDEGIKVSVLCPQAVQTRMIEVGENDDAGAGVAAASSDGTITPEYCADCVVAGIADESFLILPHENVATYMRHKTSDYDRWLKGMRRIWSQLKSS